MSVETQPVLINGRWVTSQGTSTFRAVNPATEQPLPGEYPVSPWPELDQILTAASETSRQMRGWPGFRFADFLESFAAGIDARTELLVETAHAETGLPKSPRLKDVELPRTTNQLRQAAAAARSGSWCQPVIDTSTKIRSMFGAIGGPVVVFGPNNFPYAYNGAAGGDFAAAIATGNPVIAKGHPGHPGTTKLLAEAAAAAIADTGMPPALVQMVYRTSHEDGLRLVSDPRIGAVGYTGARHTGLKLKAAADSAGKPIYLELSSINPVFILAGALRERAENIADEFTTSCLMACGQFCTNPGLVILPAGEAGERFTALVAERFARAPVGTMLSAAVRDSFGRGLRTLIDAGAALVTGGQSGGGAGVSFQNTLLRVSGRQFLTNPEVFQTEAFGNGSLFVLTDSVNQAVEIAEVLEGNLTGSLYTDTAGSDDADYGLIAPVLRTRVGRLLNDKMPTGVAVTAAMNHGGPYPATGHPGFTAVGVPASLIRFAALHCYDNVREHRLPPALRNRNPGGMWRLINGQWTTADVG